MTLQREKMKILSKQPNTSFRLGIPNIREIEKSNRKKVRCVTKVIKDTETVPSYG